MPADSTFASVDETARRRFESAWRGGERPRIEDHLPPPGDPRHIGTLEELVHIDLEMGWKSGGGSGDAPRVEDYLARFPQLNDSAVLARLARQEFRVRHKYGDRPPPEEFTSRFPEVSTLVWRADSPRDDGPPAIPGYDSLELIGRGGMGVVYKARQVKLNRPVAIKMLRHGDASPEELARFRTEAESAAKLQHPNIVQVFEVGEAAGRPFLVMEYVAGQSLDRVLAGNPQPPALAAATVAVLARAIQAAHEQGIVHRDLKPANILLPEDRGQRTEDSKDRKAGSAALSSVLCPLSSARAKVADFGLAKRIEADDGQTRTGAVLGTPNYMSPEQAAGRKDIGPASDVYSLGVILYEMLTGRTPFRTANAWDTITLVIRAEPIAPRRVNPSVPRDLDTICLKCLEKEPGKRYPSAAELAADLDRFAAGKPILARPVGVLGRAWRWCRRERKVAALLALVAVVLVVGTAVATSLWFRMERQAAERFDSELRAIDDEMGFIDREEVSLVPQMDEARREFLQNLERKCRALADRGGDSPAVRRKRADVHLRLGTIHELLGRYSEAEQSYREAVSLRSAIPDGDRVPDDAKALAACRHRMANLWRTVGRDADAEDQYRQALALAAGDAETLHDYGKLLVRVGRYAEGKAHFRLALDAHRPALADRAPTPKARLLAAQIETSLGNILTELSEFDDAGPLLESAVGRLGSLAAEFPAVPLYALGLARSLNERARWYDVQARPREARKDRARAYAIFKKLSVDHPHRPDYRFELAAAVANLGGMPVDDDKPASYVSSIAAMEQAYRDAIAMQERLAAEFPAVPDHRHRLALSLNTLATWRCDHASDARRWLQKMQRYAEALTLHQRADAIWTRLSADYPAVVAYKFGLGRSDQRHGIVLEQLGRLDEAGALYRRSIPIQTRLAELNPTVVRHRTTISALYCNLGVIADRRDDLAEAERQFRVAVDHIHASERLNPKDPVVRDVLRIDVENLAEILRRLGRYQEAGPLVREFGEHYGDGWWNYGRIFDAFRDCVGQAERDPALTSERREELVGQYSDWTVAAAHRMVDYAWAGKQHTAEDILYYLSQPELDHVRGRDDFQTLVAGVAAKKAKPK